MKHFYLYLFISFTFLCLSEGQSKVDVFNFNQSGELRTIYQQSIFINDLYSSSLDAGSYLGIGTNVWTRWGFRGNVQRKLSYRSAIELGFMYNHIKYETKTSQEYRPHQAYHFNFPIVGNSVIKHRFRLEERLFAKNEIDNRYFSSRLRYRIYNKGRLNGQAVHPKTCYYRIFAEWNFNVYSDTSDNFFLRGRYSIGYGYQFNTRFSADANYIYEHNNVEGSNKQVIMHIFHFSLRHTIRL